MHLEWTFSGLAKPVVGVLLVLAIIWAFVQVF